MLVGPVYFEPTFQIWESYKKKTYVGPQLNSLWAAEGRILSADTHLAQARCQNAGTASWD